LGIAITQLQQNSNLKTIQRTQNNTTNNEQNAKMTKEIKYMTNPFKISSVKPAICTINTIGDHLLEQLQKKTNRIKQKFIN
jgi:hypothetical protein